jgi:hypothetical protein
MIPQLRRQFNSSFTPEKYRSFLKRLDEACGTHVVFRNCETPCFFPKALIDALCQSGRELIEQLVPNPDYLAVSNASIPAEFRVPRESERPLFVQVDFGLARDADGKLQPKLVEIQGFPSLYAYQPVLAKAYQTSYSLGAGLRSLLSDLTLEAYQELLRRAILGSYSPENVVLLEIDPLRQKTLPDFILTGRLCGIETVCVTKVIKQGTRLFYRKEGMLIPIHRIYNRIIVDELVRKAVPMPFDFRDDLQVEWAGHPNWFFRISKFSIPHLRHPCVPQTWFLSELEVLPSDLENYVLKPLYSFAGWGVIVGPDKQQIAQIPALKRKDYILQERIDFEPVVQTPHGLTKAELRIMYLWLGELSPVTTIVRMGRGKMMGVDHNRNMEWVGGSVAFFTEE